LLYCDRKDEAAHADLSSKTAEMCRFRAADEASIFNSALQLRRRLQTYGVPEVSSEDRISGERETMKTFVSLLLLVSGVAFAQTPRVDNLVSPEVQPDRRVTF